MTSTGREAIATGLSRRRRLFLILVSVATSIMTVEAAARIRQYIKYGSAANTIYSTATTSDASSGLIVPTPGYRTRTISINSLGFRGPELTVAKASDTIRLAFLGGSTTFCAEVTSNEMTWPHLVWKSLQAKWPEIQFDYVNAAFVGYTAHESLQNLHYRVAKLEPDVIVIYEGINDLSKDTRQLAKEQGLFSAKSVASDSFLAKWSLAYYLIETKIKMIARTRECTRTGDQHLRFDPTALSAGFHARLRELVETAKTVAPVTAVATSSQWARADQPRDEQARALETLFFYNPYLTVDGLLAGFAEYNRVVGAVAAETGALLIGKEDSIPGDDRHFIDSVHFNDVGSQAMADRVVAGLEGSASFRALLAAKEPDAVGVAAVRTRNRK